MTGFGSVDTELINEFGEPVTVDGSGYTGVIDEGQHDFEGLQDKILTVTLLDSVPVRRGSVIEFRGKTYAARSVDPDNGIKTVKVE